MGKRLDPSNYQNLFLSAFGCSCSRSRNECDNEERPSPDVGSQIIRSIKVDLGGMAQQLLAKFRPNTESETDSRSQERKIHVWEQDPAPLQGWTETDQRLFIIAAKKAKLKSSQEPSILRQRLEKISRQIPGKSISDFEQCLRHIETSRIAYFGPKVE